MYFTLSPFFYYLANYSYIESYITICTDGKFPNTNVDSETLYSIIKKYVLNNSHGVDEHSIEKYVKYILENVKTKYNN